MKKLLLFAFSMTSLYSKAQIDSIPRVVVKKATIATELPRPYTKKVVYLAVNDTLPILGCYDGYYYVTKGSRYGFVYSPYVYFLGDRERLSAMELYK